MRLLIVEDNAFNAYCLTRLLQTEYPTIHITVAHDSVSALQALAQEKISLVILDGDLGASDGVYCNGPVLADLIWQCNPALPLVAWSDSENMHGAFAEIFKQHAKSFNEIYSWPKIVSPDRINHTLNYLMQQFTLHAVEHQEAICA